MIRLGHPVALFVMLLLGGGLPANSGDLRVAVVGERAWRTAGEAEATGDFYQTGANWPYSEAFTQMSKTAGETFADSNVVALAHAACRGNAAEVERLAKAGAEVNALSVPRGQGQITPLGWVLSCGDKVGLEALLEAGADPNTRLVQPGIGGAKWDHPEYSITPLLYALHLSMERNDPDWLKLLLKHGGDPNSFELERHTSALDMAFEEGVDRRKRGNSDPWFYFNLLRNAGADPMREVPYGETVEDAVNYGEYGLAADMIERGYRYRLDYLAVWLNRPAHIDPGSAAKPDGNPAAMRLRMLLAERGFNTMTTPRDPEYLQIFAGIAEDISRDQSRRKALPGGLLMNP